MKIQVTLTDSVVEDAARHYASRQLNLSLSQVSETDLYTGFKAAVSFLKDLTEVQTNKVFDGIMSIREEGDGC